MTQKPRFKQVAGEGTLKTPYEGTAGTNVHTVFNLLCALFLTGNIQSDSFYFKWDKQVFEIEQLPRGFKYDGPIYMHDITKRMNVNAKVYFSVVGSYLTILRVK